MGPGAIITERFRIEALAGTGGMGSVYRAVDLASNRPVAIKVVDGPVDSTRDDRFAREARILSQLRHPGIVEYITHGTHDGKLYLVMEWLDGQELKRRIDDRPLSRAEALILGQQVADALTTAHRHGVVHRDIKPSNILLVDGDIACARLIDFGIARLDTATALTRSGMLVGTPGYLAPEQAGGKHRVDGRSDLYALGAVLFHALAGRPPFTGDHVMAILAKMHFEEAPRLKSVQPDIADDLDELIARLMAKNPDERPASAAELAAHLAAMSRSSGASAHHEGSRPVISSDEQRHVSVLLMNYSPDAASPDLDPPIEIADLARAHGSGLIHLARDTLAAVFAGDHDPDTSAGRAARLALSLRQRIPRGAIAIATGRALLGESLPVGGAIDRAVEKLLGRADDATLIDRGQSPSPNSSATPIALDELTARLLERRFPIDYRGARPVLGDRDIRAPSAPLLFGRLSRCVGRRRELAALESAYEGCREDQVFHAVLIVGPVGIGKSRLGHEFIEGLRQRGSPPRIMTALGDSMHAGSSLAMIDQLLRDALAITPGDPPAIIQEAILRRLAAVIPDDGERDRIAVFLGELIGANFSSHGRLQLDKARDDPRLMADQTVLAWQDWLAAEAALAPVVLVLDDLQWSDESTVRFIDAALRALEESPIMVLALARPTIDETFPDLWATRNFDRMTLRPLARRACTSIADVAPLPAVSPDTITRLIERSGGNPLYLEQLLRSAADGELDVLPDSILALVEARLRCRAPSERRLLRAASVFGRSFWLDGLIELLGDPVELVQSLVDRMADRELIAPRRTTRFPPHREYAFTHDITREAAYATLTDDDRQAAHRKAGTWLESAGESDALLIAQHHQRGRAPDRALPWLCMAAEQAFAASDMQATIAHARSAVACGASGDVLGAMHLLQAEAHNWSSQHDPAMRTGSEAMRLLLRGSARWAHAAHQRIWAMGESGAATEALQAVIRELLDHLPSRLGDLHIAALAASGFHILRRGDIELARSLRERIRECMATNPPDHEPDGATDDADVGTRHLARAFIAELDALMAQHAGRTVEGLHFIERAMSYRLALGDEGSACLARLNTGVLYGYLGQYARALEAMTRGFEVARRLDLEYHLVTFITDKALILARQGELDEAMQCLSQPMTGSAARGAWTADGLRAQRAHVLMIARGPEAALGELERPGSPHHDERFPAAAAYALAVRSHALLAQGRPAQALTASQQSMAIVAQLGALEEADAYVRLRHAEALHACGHGRDAARAIHDAREHLLARAQDITDARWRKDFLDNIAENQRTLELASEWSVSPGTPGIPDGDDTGPG